MRSICQNFIFRLLNSEHASNDLDQQLGNMGKTRYSDNELQEFKDLILGKLKEAQEDLDLLRGSLSHSDDHGTNDTGRSFNMFRMFSKIL